ncbi:MAG TPA: hypothetical protein DCR55_17280 [Lentisphaeria bacterium]|jgi:hypothetical protein|nr:hypothetical protein [Lentisphaeria bacterium]
MKKLLPFMFIVGLCATSISQAAEPLAEENVAELEMCYISRGSGTKWHAIKTCHALKKSKNVQHLNIEDAVGRGRGKRWNSPCKFCLNKLKKDERFAEKLEEVKSHLPEAKPAPEEAAVPAAAEEKPADGE